MLLFWFEDLDMQTESFASDSIKLLRIVAHRLYSTPINTNYEPYTQPQKIVHLGYDILRQMEEGGWRGMYANIVKDSG
eukprot:2428497-Rhodomonas_salina.1